MKRNILLIALSAAVLLALFVVLKPTPEPVRDGQDMTQSQQAKVFTLEIRDGEVVEGNDVLQVAQNEQVTLKITADTENQIHLHGYDKVIKLQPGVQTVTSFTASMAGRFEAELHDTNKPVFAFEVQPR